MLGKLTRRALDSTETAGGEVRRIRQDKGLWTTVKRIINKYAAMERLLVVD